MTPPRSDRRRVPTRRRTLGALLLTALAVVALGSASAQLDSRGRLSGDSYFAGLHELALIAIVEVTQVETFEWGLAHHPGVRSTGCHRVLELLTGEFPASCAEFSTRSGCIGGGDTGARVGSAMLVIATKWDLERAREGEELSVTYRWIERDEVQEVARLMRRGLEISRGFDDPIAEREPRETRFLTELAGCASMRSACLAEVGLQQRKGTGKLALDTWDPELREALLALLDGASLETSSDVRLAADLAAWNVPEARRWLLDELAAYLAGERELDSHRGTLRRALAGVVEGRSTTGGWDDLARAQRTALKLLDREGPESDAFHEALRDVLATAPELR